MNVYEQFRADHMDKRIGVTASCFDLMHAGHILMLKEARSLVGLMVVFLQTDPTVDRPEKNKPILSMDERRILVQGCKYVDHIFEYTTEAELLEGLRSLRPDLRILGDDYVGKTFTGSDLNIPVHFHNRSVHGWSTSALRNKIWEVEDAVRAKLDWKTTEIKINTAKHNRMCPLEPTASSPEQFWKKLQSKFDQVLVDAEKDFRDEHGVDINAVIEKMKAQNRVATTKLQDAFATDDNHITQRVLLETLKRQPNNIDVQAVRDELKAFSNHLEATKIKFAKTFEVSEGLVPTSELKATEFEFETTPSGPSEVKAIRMQFEQGPVIFKKNPTIEKSFETSAELLPSVDLKIRDVELAKVRAFNNQVSQMNKDMNKALSKALSDYEKIRSQFENIVINEEEYLKKRQEDELASAARVRAKQDEWEAIGSLRQQFIAEWTAMFIERNRGRAEFNTWYCANREKIERSLRRIACEFLEAGGKAQTISLNDYDLSKYGITDPC